MAQIPSNTGKLRVAIAILNPDGDTIKRCKPHVTTMQDARNVGQKMVDKIDEADDYSVINLN